MMNDNLGITLIILGLGAFCVVLTASFGVW